jgi:hypothetical protein
VRPVEEHLVAGVGVHCGHHAVADADRLVKQLRDGREAVGRARCIRDDVVLLGVVDLDVDSESERDVRLLGRSRDDDLLGARFEVFHRVGTAPKAAGRLDYDVDVELVPRQLGRVGLRRCRDLVSIDDDASVDRLHRSLEPPIDGVVGEQVRQHCRLREVIDRNPLDVCA